MWTWKFWKLALERAVKTAAQVPLSTWLVADGALNLFSQDLMLTLQLAATGAVVSILTSIASSPVGDNPETPSLVA